MVNRFVRVVLLVERSRIKTAILDHHQFCAQIRIALPEYTAADTLSTAINKFKYIGAWFNKDGHSPTAKLNSNNAAFMKTKITVLTALLNIDTEDLKLRNVTF